MSEDVQRMKAAAERQRLIQQQQQMEQQRQAQAAAAAAAKVKAQPVKVVTPSHAEGYDVQRKTPKVYTGPKITSTTTIGETKPPEPQPIYHVGGSGPKFSETVTSLQVKADEFYSKSGLPSQVEVKDYLEKNRPATGYVAAGASPFKPKSTEEAFNRLGYAATQMLIGAAVEEGFPFSLAAVPPASRESDNGFRILGGLLVPSPADLVAGQILARLAKTKAWRKIIGQYGEVEVSELEKATAREIENLRGSGLSVAEVRAGVRKSYSNLEKIARFYKDHPELATAERSSAGSAQVPQIVLEFEDFLDDLGWDLSDYYEFVSKEVDLPVGVLVNVLAASMDRGVSVNDTVDQLEGYVDRPASSERMAERAKAAEAAAELAAEDEEEREDVVPVILQKVEHGQTVEEKPVVTLETVTETITEAEAAEEAEPPRGRGGRFIPRSHEPMRNMPLIRFYQGKKANFKVVISYPHGSPERLKVEASSYPQAMQIAMRQRTPRRDIPSEVNLWAI